MPAAEAMVLARLGLAVNCVAVGDCALCHLRRATILAFSTQQSALSFQPYTVSMEMPNRRNDGIHGSCYWLLRVVEGFFGLRALSRAEC
jgi:hypothetical protein